MSDINCYLMGLMENFREFCRSKGKEYNVKYIFER